MKFSFNLFTKFGEAVDTVDYETFKRIMSSQLTRQEPYRYGRVLVLGGEYLLQKGKDQQCISLTYAGGQRGAIRAYDDTVVLTIENVKKRKNTQIFSMYNREVFDSRGFKPLK